MIGKAVSCIALLAILSTAVIAKQCVPGDTCKAPNCRCWDDPKVPGGFDTRDIPQMILISFQYGVSRANIDKYVKLLDGIVNPNECPIRASFYPAYQNTDFSIVKGQVFDKGHEVGVSTVSPARPVTEDQWAGNFSVVQKELVRAGIPKEKIIGARAPQLGFGGYSQAKSMGPLGLTYDSSCVNIAYDAGNYLWPYTFDFVERTPECTAGVTLNQSFPGVWEFLVADLQFKGKKCASPSACSPEIKTEQDAYDLFFNAFSMHYNQKSRPPFVMFIDPTWVTNQTQVTGTRKFLQFVGAAYEDTWIVTAEQALAWIKNPVKAKKAKKFKPWGC